MPPYGFGWGLARICFSAKKGFREKEKRRGEGTYAKILECFVFYREAMTIPARDVAAVKLAFVLNPG